MIPFEIELSDIKVKDLHIIILNASESLNPGRAQSFESVNGTHFVLLHTVLFRAILNQEKNAGRYLTAGQTVNVKGHEVLAGNTEINFEFKNAAVAAARGSPCPLSMETMMPREVSLSRHLKRPGENARLCPLGETRDRFSIILTG